MKINQKVSTKFGNGKVVDIEGPYGTQSNPWYRYGVIHDNLQTHYTNNIMYFFPKEIKTV